MLGAAGALCCLMIGTALGSWMREKKLRRFHLLRAQSEAVGGMRLLLEQERPSLPDLLEGSAGYVPVTAGAEPVAQRLISAARLLGGEPLLGVEGAYEKACLQIPAPWERDEEAAAMRMLFRQLGSGTAGMREQAAASCLRRLRPLMETAEKEAANGGKLCMQLGALLGLMAGIALW